MGDDKVEPARLSEGARAADGAVTYPAAQGPYSIPAMVVTERILGQGEERGGSDAVAS
jgi:hypothetical protein